MPVTPLHYPIAKLLHKFNGRVTLSLPALIVGAMVPDLEIPFVWLFSQTQDRLVLHSLIGGLTLGTLVAVGLTVLVYPAVVATFFPVNKDHLKQKCVLSAAVVLSALLGVLSHVLLDVFNHAYNPLFWPFLGLYQTPSPIVPMLGGDIMASLIMHGLMVALIVGIALYYRKDRWNHLLVE